MIINNYIEDICSNEYDIFLNKSNVVGVAVGSKIKNGINTKELCIQVFVSKKVNKDQLSSENMISKKYKGIKTDVIETGEIKSLALTSKIRPILFGYSISPYLPNVSMAGTAGCLVKSNSKYCILSNNHVLANENKLPLNTPVLQPGTYDKGRYPSDIVAYLSKVIPIQFETSTESPLNNVDAAIASIISINQFSTSIALIGKVKGIISPMINLSVKKTGRTTGLTTGKITNTNATIRVQYSNNNTALFTNQILSTAMSSAGDSGSLLLSTSNYAVGLLFAGSNSVTVYNPIRTVLNSLDISLFVG